MGQLISTRWLLYKAKFPEEEKTKKEFERIFQNEEIISDEQLLSSIIDIIFKRRQL